MNSPDSRLTPQEREALGELSAAEKALLRWAPTLDAAVAGELDPEAMADFEAEMAQDAGLREAYEEARASRELVSRLPAEPCPPALHDSIMAAVDADGGVSRPDFDLTNSRPLRSPAPRRPQETLLRAAGMVAAAVALVAVLLPGRILWHENPPSRDLATAGYSDAEVRAALVEMRTAMAMISGAMDGTAELLRDEMHTEVGERIRKPLEEGLRRSVRPIPYLNPDAGNDQQSRILSPPRRNSEVLEMVDALERTKT